MQQCMTFAPDILMVGSYQLDYINSAAIASTTANAASFPCAVLGNLFIATSRSIQHPLKVTGTLKLALVVMHKKNRSQHCHD